MKENKTPELNSKQNTMQALKFLLFSMSAGVIQTLTFTLLNEFTGLGEASGYEYGPAYFIALTLSVLWNFTFNRKYTFKSAANVPLAMLKVFGYYCLFTPLSIWWGEALTAGAGWNKYVVLLGTMIINMATEFLFCRFVVYKNQMFTSETGKKEIGKTGK